MNWIDSTVSRALMKYRYFSGRILKNTTISEIFHIFHQGLIRSYLQLQVDLDVQLIVQREVFDDCALVFWGETKWTHDDSGDIRAEGKTSKDSVVQNRKEESANYKVI